MNKGKSFEQDVSRDAHAQGLFWLRLNDTSLSWVHEKNSKFACSNPCDFICYRLPYMFAIECKSTTYKSMSIQRDLNEPKAMIKAHQIQSLVNFSLVEGVYSGLLLNFRNDDDIDDNQTFWLPIENFSQFLCDSDKKSINKTDCIQYGGILVDQKLRRTHYSYDINNMLDNVIENKKKKEASDGEAAL